MTGLDGPGYELDMGRVSLVSRPGQLGHASVSKASHVAWLGRYWAQSTRLVSWWTGSVHRGPQTGSRCTRPTQSLRVRCTGCNYKRKGQGRALSSRPSPGAQRDAAEDLPTSARRVRARPCSGGFPTGALVLIALLRGDTGAKGGALGLGKASHGGGSGRFTEACMCKVVATALVSIRC